MLPVLALVLVLGATPNVTAAEPLPLGTLNVIHGASASAVHVQLASVTSAADPVPPPALCDVPEKPTA